MPKPPRRLSNWTQKENLKLIAAVHKQNKDQFDLNQAAAADEGREVRFTWCISVGSSRKWPIWSHCDKKRRVEKQRAVWLTLISTEIKHLTLKCSSSCCVNGPLFQDCVFVWGGKRNTDTINDDAPNFFGQSLLTFQHKGKGKKKPKQNK